MYCDGTAQLGFLSTALAFTLGYFIARRNIWSEKTNQLVRIEEVKTSEGSKKV